MRVDMLEIGDSQKYELQDKLLAAFTAIIRTV
jgi:hypothetical protein